MDLVQGKPPTLLGHSQAVQAWAEAKLLSVFAAAIKAILVESDRSQRRYAQENKLRATDAQSAAAGSQSDQRGDEPRTLCHL